MHIKLKEKVKDNISRGEKYSETFPTTFVLYDNQVSTSNNVASEI